MRPTREEILHGADDLEAIATGLRDYAAGRITPIEAIGAAFDDMSPIAQSLPITGPHAHLRAITDLVETMRHELWCETLKHPDKDMECNCVRGKLLKLATPGAEAGIGLAALKILLSDTQLLLDLERKDTAYLKQRLEVADRERDEARSLLASTTDLMNTCAREWSVPESHDESGIKQLFDRIWTTMVGQIFSQRETIAALQPPVERQWRVLDRSIGFECKSVDEDGARIAANGNQNYIAQFSDDRGKSWTDAPQGTQEEA